MREDIDTETETAAGTDTGTGRGVETGNTNIAAGTTTDHARHAEVKTVGTVANTIAIEGDQNRGHGRRITSTVAEEIARAHHPEGMIVEISGNATATDGVIAHLPRSNQMMQRPAKVRPIVSLVCKQKQHH